ncbi:RDD family protein [Aeromicrobium sp.]|uniref:RDD family protein n=1 Tax=Aeromicrobium sp. TaxID=1871063 RepID=UPI0030C0C85C
MTEFRTVRQLRRDALGQDALLFCAAFTGGALAYFLARTVLQALGGGPDGDFWSVSLSEDLILSGLIAGELFLVWNNGLRQGVRGHSIGKHRVGLAVVDVGDGAPTGAGRGLVRGLTMAVLLDLAAAAIPIGLPTVLRRLTPEEWHVGGAAYLALIVLVIPLLVPTDRGLADRLARTEVIRATGADAVTSPRRRTVLTIIDIVGVMGLLAVAAAYIVYFAPLLRFPDLF